MALASDGRRQEINMENRLIKGAYDNYYEMYPYFLGKFTGEELQMFILTRIFRQIE